MIPFIIIALKYIKYFWINITKDAHTCILKIILLSDIKEDTNK